MEKSRFSFVGKTIVSGAKVSTSMYPQLTAVSTKDKFVLNDKACALMGVAPGAYVVLMDANKGGIVNTEDPNARFYITKGWKVNDSSWVGAKIGKGNGFSYTGVYAAMMLQKPEVDSCKIDDLVDAGKGVFVVSDNGNENFIAKQKVIYHLEKLKDEDGNELHEVATDRFQEVWKLTNVTIEAHEPKTDASGNNADVDPDEE